MLGLIQFAPFLVLKIFWAVYGTSVMLTAAAVAISMGIGYLTRTKAPGGGSGDALDQSQFPTAENGVPYDIIFGTVRCDGYDCAWMGDTKIYARERSDVVVYRYYYAGTLFIYGQGPVDGFVQLWYGDSGGGKCAWPTPEDESVFAADGLTESALNAGNLYGSPYSGGTGSLLGDIDFLLGTDDQAQNAYLADKIGANVPAFRGLACIVAQRVNWGCQPYPQILGAVVKRVLIEGDDGRERWYVAKAAIDTYDLNVVHVLHECLTDTDWGEGIAAAQLGDTWEAVADALYAEGFGISCKYLPEPGNLKSFVTQLEDVADLVIYDDPVTGTIEIMAVRDDYDIDTLPILTENDVTITRMLRPHWRDVASKYTISYTNRLHPNNGATADYEDETIAARQDGRVAPKTFSYAMITSDTLAQTIVNRKGVSETARPWRLELSGKRIAAAFRRGSRFKLIYSDPDLTIAQMVCLVEEVDYGSTDDETVRLTVSEDTYAAAYSVLGSASSEFSQPTAGDETAYVYSCNASQGNAADVNATAPA